MSLRHTSRSINASFCFEGYIKILYSCRLGTGFRNMDFLPSSLSSLSRYSLSAYSSPSSCFAVFFSFCDISGLEGLFFLFSCCFAMGLLYPILAGFFDLACGCCGEMNSSLKGRFSSGLEGASAIKWFGDLTGKQPCKLMHNNHNQMKTGGLRKFSLKWLQIQKDKFRLNAGIPAF